MKNSQQQIKNLIIKIISGFLACATLISAQAQADSAAAESFIEAIKHLMEKVEYEEFPGVINIPQDASKDTDKLWLTLNYNL